MTAKPQPMAGHSDAADDLIAELAKLMAQDANTERPAQPPFPVRIPGGDAPAPMTSPQRFDFSSPKGEFASSPVRPVPVEAPGKAKTPEPFSFDFGLAAARSPAAPTQAASTPAAASPATPVEVDHDSIADLIAAELSRDAQIPDAAQPLAVDAPEYASADNQARQEQAEPQPSRTPDPQPVTRSEQDAFKIPPVFGLASRPASVETPSATSPDISHLETAKTQPAFREATSSARAEPVFAQDQSVGPDPLDEIESLIGPALRMTSKPESEVAQRPAASPALRSLATPVATSDFSADPRRVVSSADEAILAAAQATGAEIGWVEEPETADPTPVVSANRRRLPRPAGLTRAVAGPLVAVTLLLAAGFGLYWVLGLGRDAGPAPLLTADTSPVKETPAVQPDATAEQQSVVFNEINGVVPGAEEQLVSRDQADVNEVTQIPPTASVSDEGLANRKVRTVTVRPDGTIVSGEDSVAGSAILPVARPNVPAVPGAETASPELLASAQPEATAQPATPAPTATPEAPVVATPASPGSTVPAVDLAGNPLAGKTATIPLLRPAGLAAQAVAAPAPTSPVNAVVDTPVSTGNSLPPPPSASTLGAAPAATPTPAAQPVASTAPPVPGATEVEALPNNAPAYVQLASQRSEAEARATAQAMVTRYGPLFGGANMEVQRVDLGAKGIYYRVRVPANSTQEAATICTNVKAAGGDCFTM